MTSWTCTGIPPHTPPCGAQGDRPGTGVGSADHHVRETGHSVAEAQQPGTLGRLGGESDE